MLLLLFQGEAAGPVATVERSLLRVVGRRQRQWRKRKGIRQFTQTRIRTFVVKKGKAMVSYADMRVGEIIKFGFQFEDVESVSSFEVTGTGIAISELAAAAKVVSAKLSPAASGRFSVFYRATGPDGQRFIAELIVTVT
jgi:hypothetical protein